MFFYDVQKCIILQTYNVERVDKFKDFNQALI